MTPLCALVGPKQHRQQKQHMHAMLRGAPTSLFSHCLHACLALHAGTVSRDGGGRAAAAGRRRQATEQRLLHYEQRRGADQPRVEGAAAAAGVSQTPTRVA